MLYTKDRFLIKLKHYTDSIQYTLFKFSSSSHLKKKSSSSSEIARCSISRSFSTIKEYCLCNKFDFFVTITLKDYDFRTDPIKSINFINSHIKHYSRLCKSRGVDFKFLYVFERQQNRAEFIYMVISVGYMIYIRIKTGICRVHILIESVIKIILILWK